MTAEIKLWPAPRPNDNDSSPPPPPPDMEARLTKLETILDRLVDDRRDDRAESRDQQGRIEAKFDALSADIKASELRFGERFRNLKTLVVGVVISSALATVFGVAAFNSSVLQNMVASFESGKSTMAEMDKVSDKLGAMITSAEALRKQNELQQEALEKVVTRAEQALPLASPTPQASQGKPSPR